MLDVTIFREPGRYGGWPANYGIWAWGDEVVAGFTVGYTLAKPDIEFHARDRDKPFVTMQAREPGWRQALECTALPWADAGQSRPFCRRAYEPAAVDGQHAGRGERPQAVAGQHPVHPP